ncbi:RNA polymerase Rpb8 [Botrytis cinerea]
MSGPQDAQLFDEHFTVNELDHKKYVRVGRIKATSTVDHSVSMLLDINTELFPLAVGDNIRVVLATSLNLDGTKDDGKGWRDANRMGLGVRPRLRICLIMFVMGRFTSLRIRRTVILCSKAYISFGGLLMGLEGPYKKLTPLRVDYVYLLVKK